MATQPNPTILDPATRFNIISARSKSRSPSRSPVRKAQFTAHEVDPLLSNLSPDSTLKALAQTDAVSPTGRHAQDLLTQSITAASTSERALGIKAAVAGKKVREWHTELSNWEWPSKEEAGRGKGFERPQKETDEDYIGCLPVRLVDHYEERIEEIKDGLEALEVEDLKEHVLDAHILSRSRPSSADGDNPPPPLSFGQLSDFTAVITATIVQALPFLARLSVLLNTWDARLMVTRQAPELLKDLQTTQRAIKDAWQDVEQSDRAPNFTQASFHSTKADLEQKVSSLGSQFDRALDILEGREDSLPEQWIDQMDNLESDFANWVVAAENRVLVNEWKRSVKSKTPATGSEIAIPNVAEVPAAASPTHGTDVADTSSGDGSFEQSPSLIPEAVSNTTANGHDIPIPFPNAIVEDSSQGWSQTDTPQPLVRDTLADDSVYKEKPKEGFAEAETDTPQSYFRFPAVKSPPKSENGARRPPALQLPSVSHRREISEVSVADSMVSEAFSDLSNAEILNASTAEVSTPTVVESPARRFSSNDLLTLAQRQGFEKHWPQTMYFGRSQTSQTLSPFKRRASSEDRVQSPDQTEVNALTEQPPEKVMENSGFVEEIRPPFLHRASISSVEVVPKNRVRSIMIGRNNSSTSILTPTERSGTPADALRALTGDEAPMSSPPESLKHQRTRSRLSQSTTSTMSGPTTGDETSLPSPHHPHPRSPSLLEDISLPPQLPRRSSKRLTRTIDSGLSASSTSASNINGSSLQSAPLMKAGEATPLQTPTKKSAGSPLKSTDETIEEKIQDILTTIPARIHFSSSQSPTSSAPKNPKPSKLSVDDHSLPSQSNSDSSTNPSTRATTPTPSLTLTPVRPSKTSRHAASISDNSDVKVYHLSRSGPNQAKDAPPLKLFVRLVGEGGERVMVRVGGGWADLGEYLREYALHHGRSKPNMNDEQFEVKAIPNNHKAPGNTGFGSSPAGPAHSSKSYTTPRPSVPRPASALDFSRPAPPTKDTRSTRRLSAAAATLPTGAESPSGAFAMSPTSTFVFDPSAYSKSDVPPPVPAIPSQLITSSPVQTPATARSRASSGHYFDVSSPALSQSSYNPSPITPKYTPLGAAGPIKVPKQPSRPRGPVVPKSPIVNPSSPKSPSHSAPSTADPLTSKPATEQGQMSSPANDTWVQDVVGKARRAQYPSGPASSPGPSPISSTPVRNRKPSFAALSAKANNQSPTDNESDVIPSRPKSRSMSRLSSFGLGRGGSSEPQKPEPKSEPQKSEKAKTGGGGSGSGTGAGIRRVFLRKKSSTFK